jgi:hypothetical protein
MMEALAAVAAQGIQLLARKVTATHQQHHHLKEVMVVQDVQEYPLGPVVAVVALEERAAQERQRLAQVAQQAVAVTLEHQQLIPQVVEVRRTVLEVLAVLE